MGLDMYVNARKNIGTPNEERQEKVYWRKFWDLQDYILKITDGKMEDGCIEDIKLTKEELENIIHFCCFHRDYFDEFGSVPDLCELYDEWDKLRAGGWTIWYNANW